MISTERSSPPTEVEGQEINRARRSPLSVPGRSDDGLPSIADDLRRRREASLRLPPLACGRRDPLDLRPRDGSQ